MARREFGFLVAVMVVAGLQAGAAHAKKKPLENIALQWRPTTTFAELGAVDLTGLDKAAIKVEPLVDKRPAERVSLIGENREDEAQGQVLRVTTKEDAAAFCTSNLSAIMQKVGLPVATESPTVVLSGELVSFFVTETNVYVGDLSLKIKVSNRKGEVLWSGVANGGAKRWGRSYQLENYHEVLSDSLLQAVFDLLRNPRFLDALAGKHATR